jgi:oligoribonuclease
MRDAELAMLAFVRQYVRPGCAPLCGNTVHMDRRFLAHYAAEFDQYLHYRIIDVSTVKELCRRWYPVAFAGAPAKRFAHRALDDIRESVDELRYYQRTIFRQ